MMDELYLPEEEFYYHGELVYGTQRTVTYKPYREKLKEFIENEKQGQFKHTH